MEKIKVWYLINLKYMLKNKIMIFVAFFLAVLCFAIGSAKLGVSDDAVGIYAYDEVGNDIFLGLENNRFSYYLYDDKTSMENDVINGSLVCGFAFPEDLGELIKKNDFRKSVECITSGNPYTEVIKEEIFASFLDIYTDNIITEQAGVVFKTDDISELSDDLIQRKNNYLNSDLLFDINLIYINKNEYIWTKKNISIIGSMIALLGWMAVYFLYGKMYDRSVQKIRLSLTKSDKIIYTISLICAIATIVLPTCLIMLICEGLFNLREVIRCILMIMYSFICAVILQRNIKKQETYVALFPVLLLIFILVFVIQNYL